MFNSSAQNNLAYSDFPQHVNPASSQWAPMGPWHGQQASVVPRPGTNMSSYFRPPRKKALLIGINYHQASEHLKPLKGCHDDVRKVHNFLRNFYYEDITVLIDDPKYGLSWQPTVHNILFQLRELVRDAGPGDSLFLHYSGGSKLRANIHPYPSYCDSRLISS